MKQTFPGLNRLARGWPRVMEAVREKAIGPGAARAQGFVSCVYHRRTSACVDVEIRQVGEVLKHRFVDQPCASLQDVVRIREDRHICDAGAAGYEDRRPVLR